jgi:hypothetical protein
MIEDFAKLIPKKLLRQSGSVFYSGRNAFAAPASLYILGLNPGGCPEKQADETVPCHTRKVMQDEPDDWSAYRDESWRNAIPGTSGMQPRVLHLLRQIGMAPGDIPASNVVFVRSQRESALGANFQALADLCWPFHDAIVRKLRARVILCFGRTAGDYVRKKLGASVMIDQFVENNKRKWKSCSYKSAQGAVLIVATHPSIADWTNTASDPTRLVLDVLAG